MSSFRSRIRGRKPSSGVATAEPQTLAKGGKPREEESTDTSTTSAGTNDSMEMPSDSRTVGEVEEEQSEIKDQVILTDPKYKSNRIEKSSSRSRVVPLTSRKISAPPVMEGQSHGGSKGAPQSGTTASVAPKKNTRSHSHLNLNSLLKYKSLLYAGSNSGGSTGDKKLTSEDFDKMRKKSMSEVARAAQPNSDATNSVKLIRHEFIDEVDDASCDPEEGEESGAVTSVKMSLSDKVAAKLNESKKKRSKSKSTRKRRGSRRSSCNNSSVNIPLVLAMKLEQEAKKAQEGEGNSFEDRVEDEQELLLLGGWFYNLLKKFSYSDGDGTLPLSWELRTLALILIGCLACSAFTDRPVSSITRQPSDRRTAGGNTSVPSLSTQGSVTATDNGNTSMHHHQGSFSSPKNGAAGLPSTVTDALAAQGIDINTSFKEGEKQQQQR